LADILCLIVLTVWNNTPVSCSLTLLLLLLLLLQQEVKVCVSIVRQCGIQQADLLRVLSCRQLLSLLLLLLLLLLLQPLLCHACLRSCSCSLRR
jgi:hypothetical protein